MSSNAPNPAEELASKVNSLRSRMSSLQSSVLLSNLKDSVEDLDTMVNKLDSLIGSVRQAGYAFDGMLEKKAEALKKQWPQLRTGASSQIAQQVPVLQGALRQVETQFNNLAAKQANIAAARPLVSGVESAVDALESKVRAAESAIRGSFDSFSGEANVLNSRLEKLQWMMTQTTEATFQLLPTEAVVAVVEAKWDQDGKEDPKGVLFLTDQRLLFEQKEEVATKKVLFITTAKEKVHKLLMDMPAAEVEKVTASKKGLLGHEDHIDVQFVSGAKVRAAHFHLDGQDCNEWQGMINRAKAKDFDKDRVVKIDQAELDKVKNAPTQCSNCGGKFTKPVLRGQTEIVCEYCGAVARL